MLEQHVPEGLTLLTLLEQFVLSCSPWDAVTLEKFPENSPMGGMPILDPGKDSAPLRGS